MNLPVKRSVLSVYCLNILFVTALLALLQSQRCAVAGQVFFQPDPVVQALVGHSTPVTHATAGHAIASHAPAGRAAVRHAVARRATAGQAIAGHAAAEHMTPVAHAIPVAHAETHETAAGSAAGPIGNLTVTGVVPNDDSALVSFSAVSGAKDYRAYIVTSDGRMIKPSHVKYSGASLSIEMNGLNPARDNYIVVEAVDALGPFEDMAPSMMATMDMIINGQGPATNKPNVIARSAVFHVRPQSRRLTGKQVFFDTFRAEQPLKLVPAAQLPAECLQMNTVSSQALYQEYQNDKWSIRLFDHEPARTEIFVMAEHYMDVLYDFHGILRAKMAMIPKWYPTLAAGEYLHVTFEVDAHLDLNRTIGVAVLPASARLNYNLINDLPTSHGSSFDWQVTGAQHLIYLGDGKAQTPVNGGGAGARWGQMWASGPMGAGQNGDQGDLDKRHRFDLYLSATRAILSEAGQIVRDVKFAAPQTWLVGKPLQVAYYHYLYHDRADRVYLSKPGFMYPLQTYWLGPRAESDERHWDNMGFEVVTAPPLSPTLTSASASARAQ